MISIIEVLFFVLFFVLIELFYILIRLLYWGIKCKGFDIRDFFINLIWKLGNRFFLFNCGCECGLLAGFWNFMLVLVKNCVHLTHRVLLDLSVELKLMTYTIIPEYYFSAHTIKTSFQAPWLEIEIPPV
jgi:hypothetical protein